MAAQRRPRIFRRRGRLRVSGRKKDIIVSAYGKNISPDDFETGASARAAHSPRPWSSGTAVRSWTALLTLDPVAVAEWAGVRSRSLGVEHFVGDPNCGRRSPTPVDQVNASSLPPGGHPAVATAASRPDRGSASCTPTLKVAQRVVAGWADVIDEMYAAVPPA